MREHFQYRTEAKANLPTGYYVLSEPLGLQATDIVWSWSSSEWLRADAPQWKTSPLIYSEDIICAARKIEISEFEKAVPTRRNYTIR